MLSHRPVPQRLLLLSLSCSAVILALTISYPFNNDNALFAYMSALALEGQLPYLGSWDQNFPGIILIHIPQIVLFGRSQLAFHIWDVALQLVGAYFLFRLGLRWGGRQAAYIAPVIGAFYYVQQGLWMAGERDTYVSILLLACLYLISDRRKLAARTTTCGILLGLAILFRPTYSLVFPAFIVHVWLTYPKADRMRLVTGVVIPAVAVALIYLFAGGLDDLYEATIKFNTELYLGEGAVFSFWEPIRFYWWVVPFALAGLGWMTRSDRDAALMTGLTLLGCIVSLILLYRHSVYHYHPAMTLFLLMAAVGFGKAIEWMIGRAVTRSGKLVIRTTCVVVLMALFAFQTVRGNTVKHFITGVVDGQIRSIEQAYDLYEGSPEFGVGIQQKVGEYLAAHCLPGDPVQMFGPYSYPQYYSKTVTASRFQTLHALTMRKADGPLTPMQQTWRREYLADMQRVRPTFFIVCDAPEAFRQFYGGRLGHEILREDMIEVGEWLLENYEQDTVIGAFTVYRKRGE